MMDFEFESDEEEELEKAVREILEKRSQKIGTVMQTTTHDDLQIIVSHEPDSPDEESRSIGNAKNDYMTTESSDDESTKYQTEENVHLMDPMNDEGEMASELNGWTDKDDLTSEFGDLTNKEKMRSELNDLIRDEKAISIPKIPPKKHETRSKKKNIHRI
ncbi:uncharacterized protein LOC141856548 isoform X2 [Brevipalpus obovatus]|uniref:uncharacterized protein LOC141856548 isoform X2 n=1 Tax=Brevipalpus obovatus TaxID=246614 RepID=UPI003D9FA615